ncbi:hypothetical protein [Clostridium scatologenes]|uniref:Uncharacterized protein n=1 Tax=Clostridium scatologenes TaxID=1548 RepID=A0A0E3JNF1_CLOSL|nr:hypothetical protein [Clostridium scatologenes]AKA69179.1 hypothetical protein CSCA_2054 [Clostridium scatologenes]
MLVRNTNFLSVNLHPNINSYNQIKNISKSTKQAATAINEKNAAKNSDESLKQKIKIVTDELKITEDSEQKFQYKMSILKEKQTNLNRINDIGNQIKDLSKQYKSSSHELNTSRIESKATDLLNTLMKKGDIKDGNIVEDNLFKLDNSNDNISIIFFKKIDKTQNIAKASNTVIITKDVDSSIKVSVKDLLEHPSIIDENILNPIQTSLKNVNESKLIVFSNFMKNYSMTNISIDKLYKLGAISSYTKDVKMKQQKSIYESICKSYC